jgi:exonuclease III
MRFFAWNVRSLYRSGSLTTVARYELDVVGLQEVRWDKGGTEQRIIFFSTEREAKIVSWGQDFLYTTEKYQQLREECLLMIG